MEFKTKRPVFNLPTSESLDLLLSPKFRYWFGESKIVDSLGKPLVVYHGTTSSFDEIETEKTQRLPGFWVTPDVKLACSYAAAGIVDATRYPSGAVVMPLYAKVERPYHFNPDTEHFSQAWENYMEGDFDGFVEFGNDSPGMTTINVKDARQIKSAIGNLGQFDPHDPRITA